MDSAALKISYLLFLAFALFFLDNVMLLTALLVAQVVLLLVAGIRPGSLGHIAKRMFWFSLFILFSYLFVAPAADATVHRISLGGWDIRINLSALIDAVWMLMRVYTLVLASVWVQRTVPPGSFVASLKKLAFPEMAATAISATLAVLDAKPGGGTGGGRHRKDNNGEKQSFTWKNLKSGAVSGILGFIERTLDKSYHYLKEHHPHLSSAQVADLSLIVFFGLAVMGIKVFQLFPGLPVAPGHKNILIVPMFLLVALLTRGRWGGFYAGLTAGFVSFMLGYGKYGILEIAQFIVPGMLADLAVPFIKRSSGALRWTVLLLSGALMGFGRFTANILVVMLAGSPEVAFLLLVPMLISQVSFGTASVVVSSILLAPGFLDKLSRILDKDKEHNND